MSEQIQTRKTPGPHDLSEHRPISGAAIACRFEKYRRFQPIDLPDRQWPIGC